MIDVQQILKAIEAHVRGWIQEMGGTPGSGGYAPKPHDLSSDNHTGSISDAQGPQFLKSDGSRTLTGNQTVADGVTIDGVDVSALGGQVSGLASDFSAHDGATAGAAHTGGVGDHNHQSAGAQGGLLDHGSALTGLGDDDHAQYLRADGARAVAGNLVPDMTDARDLGAIDRLWRRGWLSELDAVVFAENTQTLVGGYLVVGKGQGTLGADTSAGAVSVNFGQAMTVGDFIVLRAAGQVEYMRVGALVSGTTYSVTRNLDGSGANAWPKGSVYLVLGQDGAGRIVLNAVDTPRIQILRQGTGYNLDTELARLGDMNGAFGFTAEEYGIGLGDYAGGNYLRYGPVKGFKLQAGDGKLGIDETGIKLTPLVYGEALGNYETALKWFYAAASKDVLYMYPVVNTSAKRTQVNFIAEQPSDADEDSDSSFYFSMNSRRGGGLGRTNAWMDLTFYGLFLNNDAQLDWGVSIYPRVYTAGVDVMLPEGWYPAYFEDAWVYVSATSYKVVGKNVTARYHKDTLLRCKQGGSWKYFRVISSTFSTDTTVTVTGGGTYTLVNAAITDNWLSYAATPQGFPDWFTTGLHTYTAPLTSTAWNGTAYSTTGKTVIDLSAVFGVPANVKSVLLFVWVRDSGSAGVDTYLILGPTNSNLVGMAIDPHPVNDRIRRATLVVPCDSNGDIYYQIGASGVGTFDVFMQVFGYEY